MPKPIPAVRRGKPRPTGPSPFGDAHAAMLFSRMKARITRTAEAAMKARPKLRSLPPPAAVSSLPEGPAGS